jgi:2-polyprenyl-3-methyl-5-hydroxy-6-metoxy-1,4-benzoquinol methylase
VSSPIRAASKAFITDNSVERWRILDAGAGEGKNAVYAARRGAEVMAIELSSAAITNAHRQWPREPGVSWIQADIRTYSLPSAQFDLVISYGLLHCFDSAAQIAAVVRTLMQATKPGGYHIVCTFNARSQDLRAHPGFEPCLLSHDYFLWLYRSWDISCASDSDLQEVHPHNLIPHTHSMTRFIARKSDAVAHR